LPLSSNDFYIVPDLIRKHAKAQASRTALIDGDTIFSYNELDSQMDCVAAALQQAGLKVGESIALCGVNSVPYVVLFLGALRAGIAPALIAPSSTADSIATMTQNSQAKLLFLDEDLSTNVTPLIDDTVKIIPLTTKAVGAWYASAPQQPETVTIERDLPFNIIYSSGTTGAPKGIVQSHGMRSEHIDRAGVVFGYGPSSVTLIATPLYSNTTLVSFIPAIALGGAIVIAGKFNAANYIRLASLHRATHAMLVPVQYKRIMALADFEEYDLNSFLVKFCTSAPFASGLKADIVKRWPGGLIEFYGMTEGGGTCVLAAHLFPEKLHTVGTPAEGHDIRLIDDEGKEVGPGEVGEVVGSSNAMMKGYHGQPEKTRESEWYDPSGKRFIRTGDVGIFDEDGFLTLMDRKKDMIISGGFNIYPSDLEAELITHEAIADVAVIGVPSEDWGETPVAVVVKADGAIVDAEAIKSWLSERVGKTQRLHDVIFIDELPRSAIGKVLKRELRDNYIGK
jgi:long-chain acyl-CoA synthetase